MTQTLSSLGSGAPEAAGLNETQLLDVYRTMRTIRAFEDRVHDEFATGDIPGFVHLYAGEEAVRHRRLRPPRPDRDTIASTHRGHGHCIAKGVDMKPMMAEIFGKPDGILPRQGRLDAHRRPVQGHARRQRHRRRRAAADLRHGAGRQDRRATAASASRSSATAPPTRAPRSRR